MSTEEDDRNDAERKNPFFSCAFCHATSPKPFKVCEVCGHNAPEGEETEEAEEPDDDE
jgi:hypothetical protein